MAGSAQVVSVSFRDARGFRHNWPHATVEETITGHVVITCCNEDGSRWMDFGGRAEQFFIPAANVISQEATVLRRAGGQD